MRLSYAAIGFFTDVPFPLKVGAGFDCGARPSICGSGVIVSLGLQTDFVP